jgi:hypothetical protein
MIKFIDDKSYPDEWGITPERFDAALKEFERVIKDTKIKNYDDIPSGGTGFKLNHEKGKDNSAFLRSQGTEDRLHKKGLHDAMLNLEIEIKPNGHAVKILLHKPNRPFSEGWFDEETIKKDESSCIEIHCNHCRNSFDDFISFGKNNIKCINCGHPIEFDVKYKIGETVFFVQHLRVEKDTIKEYKFHNVDSWRLWNEEFGYVAKDNYIFITNDDIQPSKEANRLCKQLIDEHIDNTNSELKELEKRKQSLK